MKLEGVQAEQAEDVATALQPLLEQEAQLESVFPLLRVICYVTSSWYYTTGKVPADPPLRIMIADANAQRKYEDGKALAEALADIRLEIGRVTQKAIS